MPRSFVSLALVAVAAKSSGAPPANGIDEVSLLQVSFGRHTQHRQLHFDPLDTAMQIGRPTEYRETGGMQCGLNHSEDLYRPIPQVLAEHPGVDGYCYWELHAPWMSYLGKTEDYVASSSTAVLTMRANPALCPNFPGAGKGPLTPISYAGVELWSHLDCLHQGGDDVYCHALGWLRNQRLDASLMANATAWEELAAQECNRMNKTYQFADSEVTMGKHLDDQRVIWSPPENTARNYNLHAYHKCLLGHAADEMAYCMSLSCLLPPGNVIGHGPWCQ